MMFKKKRVKKNIWIKGFLILISVLFLSACASTELQAPPICDNYGQNCDPKIPINQWTP